jgi:hypothetical protein
VRQLALLVLVLDIKIRFKKCIETRRNNAFGVGILHVFGLDPPGSKFASPLKLFARMQSRFILV